MTVRMLVGDCRDVLAGLPAGSVHTCVTSPPYWALRSYLPAGHPDKARELGAERTIEEYIGHLVEVFEGVRRVLRDDGTCWINIGDSFFGSGGSGGDYLAGGLREGQPRVKSTFKRHATLKPKDLCLTPFRVAIALQEAGWWVRSDVIWAKRNCMPESVLDRPTRAHEYILLLTRAPRYYFDSDAIREPYNEDSIGRYAGAMQGVVSGAHKQGGDIGRREREKGVRGPNPAGRISRDVWHLATQGFAGAHFATFPTEIPRRCILAGSPEKCCPTCGKGWVRERQPGDFDETRPQTRRAMELIQKHGLTDAHLAAVRAVGITDTGKAMVTQNGTGRNREELQALAAEVKAKLRGYYRELLWRAPGEATWRPGCACPDNDGSARAVVLDCFSGAGTTLLVADRLGRDGIGIELNPEYARMATDRIKGDAPLLVEVTTRPPNRD